MASCNGCNLAWLKRKYGERLIKQGGSWYVRDPLPELGQGEPYVLSDRPKMRFVARFMSEAHSYDEDCAL